MGAGVFLHSSIPSCIHPSIHACAQVFLRPTIVASHKASVQRRKEGRIRSVESNGLDMIVVAPGGGRE